MIYNFSDTEIPVADQEKMRAILKESDCPFESLINTFSDTYLFTMLDDSTVIVKLKALKEEVSPDKQKE